MKRRYVKGKRVEYRVDVAETRLEVGCNKFHERKLERT